MYSKILVPIDLNHAEKLEKAIKSAVDIAKQNSAKLMMVGVSGSTPSEVAHNPAEFKKKFEAYVADQSQRHNLPITAIEEISTDVAADLPDILIKEAEKNSCDLIVMASHAPGLLDHIFTSNAGHVAIKAKISVFIVRG